MFTVISCGIVILPRYERDMSTMVRVIREFLKIPETTFSTQEIQDVCGILNVNAHEVVREKLVLPYSRRRLVPLRSPQLQLQHRLCTPTSPSWSTPASTTPANTSTGTTGSSYGPPSTSRRENTSASTTATPCGAPPTGSSISVHFAIIIFVQIVPTSTLIPPKLTDL